MAASSSSSTNDSEMILKASVVQARPLVTLGKGLYLQRPKITAPPSTTNSTPPPAIILIFAWMGAKLSHIRKYSDLYDEIYPEATKIIVQSTASFFWSTEHAKRANVMPIVDALEVMGCLPGGAKPLKMIADAKLEPVVPYPTPRVLVHAFSNGGSWQLATLSNILHERATTAGYPDVPSSPSAIVLDSCPGNGGVEKTVKAFTTSVRGLFLKRFVTLFIRTVYFLYAIRRRLFRERGDSIIDDMKATLHRPKILPWLSKTTPRLYIYSKGDDIIPHEEVERHAEQARKEGLDVKMLRFDDSPHVAHARMHPQQYWDADDHDFEASEPTIICIQLLTVNNRQNNITGGCLRYNGPQLLQGLRSCPLRLQRMTKKKRREIHLELYQGAAWVHQRCKPAHGGRQKVNGPPNPAFAPISAAGYFADALQVAAPTRNLDCRVYYSPPKFQGGEVMVCHHGAGYSGLSFACFAKEVTEMSKGECGILAMDARRHGKTVSTDGNDDDLSIEVLVDDFCAVIEGVFPQPASAPTLLLIGHSMGGSVVVRGCAKLQEKKYRITGVAVLEAVEGFAIEALPHMNSLLNARPDGFDSMERAIEWHVSTNTIHNATSARISIPSIIRHEEGAEPPYQWRTPLRSTAPYWLSWFQGLSSSFLNARTARLLVLAGTDRLDKELMIGQMQGKFQMVVVPGVGHMLHEDNPTRLAEILVEFWRRNEKMMQGFKKIGDL
ncbi:hypothetical protein D9619_004998 [Psilocybe cf. subviscida]|uniref:Protein phosphatase methylesterase 1 n=1 Tax=Psilocybe cf. subviscida TaxID=2480587 RepID=A0A8H5F8B6_9AGAR|nr:hypothetical protein D9619_004998 [Psilocybe cf. subviscida]